VTEELKIDNGAPNVHCGNPAPHVRHGNTRKARGSWCDGIPPLEPFVELTIRATLTELFGIDKPIRHDRALHLIAKYGMGMLVDCIDKPDTAMVLRVRTNDGRDKVYPIIKSSEGQGFKAVLDAPGHE
jgi:hypothetical protein